MSIFGWLSASTAPPDLPEIYPIPILQASFVEIDIQNIYTRILNDVFERTLEIPEDFKKLLWDNCLGSESQDGLITMLAKAMASKKELYLVFNPGINLIRKATQEEQNQIRNDYAASSESKVGVFITFKNYTRTDMVKFYSALEYCSVGGLYKAMNLSKAVQIKISELRSSVGLNDKADAVTQMKAIAENLKNGRDIGLDAKDIIETVTPDLTATNSAMEFIAMKQSFYLGMPSTWITGLRAGGLGGDSGMSNSRDIERGLRPYFFSIVKPVIDTLFDINSTFDTEDFEMLAIANETLKTFDITSNDFISLENKMKIINQIFGLPEDAEGDAPENPQALILPLGAPAFNQAPPKGNQ